MDLLYLLFPFSFSPCLFEAYHFCPVIDGLHFLLHCPVYRDLEKKYILKFINSFFFFFFFLPFYPRKMTAFTLTPRAVDWEASVILRVCSREREKKKITSVKHLPPLCKRSNYILLPPLKSSISTAIINHYRQSLRWKSLPLDYIFSFKLLSGMFIYLFFYFLLSEILPVILIEIILDRKKNVSTYLTSKSSTSLFERTPMKERESKEPPSLLVTVTSIFTISRRRGGGDPDQKATGISRISNDKYYPCRILMLVVVCLTVASFTIL